MYTLDKAEEIRRMAVQVHNSLVHVEMCTVDRLGENVSELREKYDKLLAMIEATVQPAGESDKLWDVTNPQPMPYHESSETITPFPGLYFYSGFGMGYCFTPDGVVRWSSPDEAKKFCNSFNVEFKYIDSFRHRGYYKR